MPDDLQTTRPRSRRDAAHGSPRKWVAGSARAAIHHPAALLRADIQIEDPVQLSRTAEVQPQTMIGRYTSVGPGVVIHPDCEIGRFCSISRNAQIGPPELPTSFLSTHPFQFDATQFADDSVLTRVQRVAYATSARRTIIGHDVWIGTNAVIRQGVNVSHGAIIGACAMVTRYVPPYAIVAGNPARILRYRFSADIIAALVALQWWNRPVEELQLLPFSDVARCIQYLREPARRVTVDTAA